MLNFLKNLFGKKAIEDVSQISEPVYLSEKKIKVGEELIDQSKVEANVEDLDLEIKTIEKKEEIDYTSLPPYDPFLALPNYQFPLKSFMLVERFQINENI